MKTLTSLIWIAALRSSVGHVAAAGEWVSQLKPCPQSCAVLGGPSNWTAYNSVKRLDRCQETMLLEFNLYNNLEDPETQTQITACTADTTNSTVTAKLQVLPYGQGTEDSKHYLVSAAQTVQTQINSADAATTKSTISVGYRRNVAVAFYAGAGIKTSSKSDFLKRFLDQLETGAAVETLLMQICGDGRSEDYVMGAIAETSDHSLSIVQQKLKTWNEGNCLSDLNNTATVSESMTLYQIPNVPVLTTPISRIRARDNCKTVAVVSGDNCGTLTTKCGISSTDLAKYNPASDFCSTLQPGQNVCCSSGSLPTPQKNDDGSCAVYQVQPGDFCSKIAASNNIKISDLESANKKTWGWLGCENLQPNMNICLSSGDPPMPAPLSNAECGPQVLGTERPAAGTNLADLNPCPLNACCDVWGFCGVTKDFCTPTNSSTGNPGTAAPNTNGCISNCGTDIISSSTKPSQFIKLGYFEAWNLGRECLNMGADQISVTPGSGFTHVHFAFGGITEDFQITMAGVEEQFLVFTRLTGVKKILSFGGWSFSTSADSYPIFREGVTAENRATFIKSVLDWVSMFGLDGVDFDWEYPGAPDIPGIPAGSPKDGENYVAFLRELRALLPWYKSVSIAAPASYWYLKGFPIKEIAHYVDYIVYMTYDLAGQWNYGNAWSAPGCDSGDCLRSHVNITETFNALAMITKAGVSSTQVVVGVSSYGRSFKMTDPNCTGAQCTFVGPESGATPGRCTVTAGYISNAEIDEIISSGKRDIQTYIDVESDSQILVYDGNWVAYMNDDNKAKRTKAWMAYNFAGTTDWAVDLQEFLPFNDDDKVGTDVDWRTVGCKDSLLDDVTADPLLRWRKAGTPKAWMDWNIEWKMNGNSSGLTYSNAASAFFKGRDHFECGRLTDVNNCHPIYECLDDHDRPWAATFILNSMIQLETMSHAMVSAIQGAETKMNSLLGTFAATFAPAQTDSNEWLKILLDVLGLVTALSLAPVWNIVLKESQLFAKHANELATIKDSVNSMITTSYALAKDTSVASQTISHQNDLGLLLAQVTDTWANLVNKTHETFFDGSDEAIKKMGNLFNDGMILETDFIVDDVTLTTRLTRALMAVLIPQAWLEGELAPVILDDDIDCVDGQYPADADDHNHFLYPDGEGNDREVTRFCYNGKGYHLMTVGVPSWNSKCLLDDKKVKRYDCRHRFIKPAGIESLNNGDWGITGEDLVASAVAGYQKNGNKNGGEPLDPGTEDGMNYIFDGDIRAPGLVSIPVCSSKAAFIAWMQTYHSDYEKPPTWPCDPDHADCDHNDPWDCDSAIWQEWTRP